MKLSNFIKIKWPEEVMSNLGLRVTTHPSKDAAVGMTAGNPWITEVKDANHAVLDTNTSLVFAWQGNYTRVCNRRNNLVNILFPEFGTMWFVSDTSKETAKTMETLEELRAATHIIPTPNSTLPFDIKLPRPTIADKAKEIIYGDREKTYGSPDKNLKAIASLWSAYLAARPAGTELNINDVCAMMRLLKEARLINSPEHEDSMIDSIGYMLLQDLCQRMDKETNNG